MHDPTIAFARSARLRAGLNHALMGVLLVALAGLLAWLSTRDSHETDWTATGRHLLSDGSLALLKRLEAPLEITAYAREQPEVREAVRRFVSRYQRHYPAIALQFVNLDAAPDEARALGIGVNGELVLRYQGRIEHVRSDSEQEFANALQRLLRGSERWIAFIEGHGERSALGRANHDLESWARQLKSRGFNFNPLNLGERLAIPDNTAVLVIAGPQADYLPGEAELVRAFLERGGNFLWLLDPGTLHGLEAVAELLRIRLLPGTIIDAAGQLLGLHDPTIALVTSSLYGAHPALQGFSLTTVFPGAGALSFDADGNWRAQPLLSSGTHAWLETGPLQGEVELDAGADLPGPLTIGLALGRDLAAGPGLGTRTVEQRIAVIADGDFLSNAYAGNSGNPELGLRLLNWLSRDDDLIRIQARTAADLQLELAEVTVGILGLFFLFLLPALFATVGLTLWWRRKSR